MRYTNLTYSDFKKSLKNGRTDFSHTVVATPKSGKSAKKAASGKQKQQKAEVLENLSFEGGVFPPNFTFFKGKHLKNCNFDFAVLNEVNFDYCLIENCSFNRASLQKSSFCKATADKDTSFTDADMRFASLKGVNFKGINAARANLNEAEFTSTSVFDEADFRGANLCFLHKANLASWQGADFSDALINKNRASGRFKGANIREARASGQLDTSTKNIYTSMITNAFTIKGKTFRQKENAEKRIAEYALQVLDKMGLRHSAVTNDKKGLLTFRLTGKSGTNQKILKELLLKSKNNSMESQSNYKESPAKALVTEKIKGQSR